MSAFCAAVDWGTSTFRLWLFDRSGMVLAERRSPEGMMAAIEAGFEAVLERHLSEVGAPPDLPVVICGMAGARQGWREAAYLDAPADLRSLADSAIAVEGARREVRILPGIAQRDGAHPDVMRGEETQLLGLAAMGDGTARACLPGTHCKWVALQRGRVERFATFMTGELYAVISSHSILRLAMAGERREEDGGAAFEAALRQAFEAPADLAARLFSLRASQLLGYARPEDAAPALSGLLIGAEIASAAAQFGPLGEVVLVAGGVVGASYRRAFELLQIPARTVDADDAVRRGLWKAAEGLWNRR